MIASPTAFVKVLLGANGTQIISSTFAYKTTIKKNIDFPVYRLRAEELR